MKLTARGLTYNLKLIFIPYCDHPQRSASSNLHPSSSMDKSTVSFLFLSRATFKICLSRHATRLFRVCRRTGAASKTQKKDVDSARGSAIKRDYARSQTWIADAFQVDFVDIPANGSLTQFFVTFQNPS